MTILLIGGAVAWWINGNYPADESNNTPRLFVIQKGEGIRSIANSLKNEGLIRDPVVFFLLVRALGLDGKIQAGEFYLSPSMSTTEIASALQVGTFDIRVTIPEGKRAQEIADILKQHLPTFDESWRVTLDANEGYLFPDTYAFAKDATLDQVVSLMRNNFEEKYATIPNDGTKKLTREQIVILASMVEREARLDEDRPMVASVMLNRLGIGMKLDIDATIQYALGYNITEKTWWKKGLTMSDINLNSPYNTYQVAGLPPTPISNPGIEALQAVLTAPETDYLYYLTDPATGRNQYSKTLKEHHAKVKKYGLE